MGQSTCVGIGGDPINGTNFIDVLSAFQADPKTEAVIMIGEIGGTAEEEAAAFVKAQDDQAGGRLRRGPDRSHGEADGPRRRHHLRRKGNGGEKIEAFRAAGISVSETPSDMGKTLARRLGLKVN